MKNISRRTVLAGMGGAAASLALAACGNSGSSSAETTASTGNDVSAVDKTFKIGIIQLTQHDALDKAHDGFIAALDAAGLKYELDDQNANNEQSTCTTAVNQFIGEGVDLIYAIATPAAQAALAATTEIPIVGSAITDYAASGLVASNETPGGNLTGTSDMNPVDEQIAMLKKIVPDAKKVGMLYCSAESNSELQVEMAEAACAAAGLETERFTVSSSNEVQSVVESMLDKVDAGYSPTDNTIAAAAAQIGEIVKGKLPFVVGEQSMCEGMGVCTLSIDYQTLGEMAGEMALTILVMGANPGEMAIQTESTEQLEVIKNEEMAASFGIDLSVLDA